MFSNTVSRGKMFVTWKLRASPRRAMWNGRMPAISSPFSAIDPFEGARRPLTRLKSVDLPAPLGPMIAWRSPTGISSDTPRMIAVAPKLLCTSRSVSALSGIGGLDAVGVAGKLPRCANAGRGAAQEKESGERDRRRTEPRPWRGGVHRDPEELHARSGLGLRRQSIRDLEERRRADDHHRRRRKRDGVGAQHEGQRARAQERPMAREDLRKPAGRVEDDRHEEDPEVQEPRRRVPAEAHLQPRDA